MKTQKDDLIPPDLPTIKAVYEHETGQVQQHAWLGQVGLGEMDAYTRDASNEIDDLFPLLPNPKVAIYIDPHINAAGTPIPGYTTPIFLYRQNYFALPGEPTL